MYLTQSSFFGKTMPFDPSRMISVATPNERSYPNRWMEDRNLRSLHKKSHSFMK